eukprot:jgi/Ulvmu1/2336/UM013_0184.1
MVRAVCCARGAAGLKSRCTLQPANPRVVLEGAVSRSVPCSCVRAALGLGGYFGHAGGLAVMTRVTATVTAPAVTAAAE